MAAKSEQSKNNLDCSALVVIEQVVKYTNIKIDKTWMINLN